MTTALLPLKAALAYADRGWPVLPLHTPGGTGCSCLKKECTSVGKHPRTMNGLKDATTDPEVVKRWWSQWPQANIGIVTGAESGLIVLDVDAPNGEEALNGYEIPDTAEQLTGRGRQIIFKRPPDDVKYSNSTGLFGPGSNVDVRADGGYIVAPPSLHYTGKNYIWEMSSDPMDGQEVAPAPTWLLDKIRERPAERKTAASVGETIIDGARNTTLTSLAGSMRRRGMGAAEIEAALMVTNSTRCVPPLAASEVTTLAKGFTRYEPAALADETSILEAASALTPGSPSDEIAEIVKAASENLGPVSRHGVYARIKKVTGLPLYAIKSEAAAAFSEEEPDQLDLARKVREYVGPGNVLCTDGDVWKWDTAGVWQVADDREVKGRIHKVVEEEAGVDVTKSCVDGVFDIFKTEIFRPGHAWNADTDLINFANGALRITPGGVALEAHNREHYCNVQIPIKYNPDAPAPKHLIKFLDSIWREDPESIGTLQELVGYLLTSDTSQQKIPMLVGPKRSGKGTIGRLLVKLLGRHNVCGPTLSSLQQNFGLAPLIGKTLAIISDARLDSRANQQSITERLLSISGEDTLSIPRKYLDDYTGKLSTRFLIMTNELPRLADNSGALASRFIILKMTESFYGREDHGLDARLAGELPGILNWSLDGLRRLQERGDFVQPSSAAEAIEELSDLGSPISAFLRNECIVRVGAEVACHDLYESWRLWCGTQGRDHPGTAPTFGRDLRAALPGLKTENRRNGTGGRTRVYSGVGLGGGTQWNVVHTIVRTKEDIHKDEGELI